LRQNPPGEDWDGVVKFAVRNDLSGIETLSWIPGKAGSAPVQNIGAYGTEISDYIKTVEVYDKKKGGFASLNNKDCQFSYRDSLFKKQRNRFIIVSVTLSLSKNAPKIPKYKDVENYFKEKNKKSPNLKEIRKAIIKIRKNKLPDPKVVPNCGSFFKNPIIGKRGVAKIKKVLPDSPLFPIGHKFKIPAGFLIEKAGFKGKQIGRMKVHENNALVLTNPNRVPFSDLIKAKNKIQNTVYKKFGIMLEPEVNIIE